LDSKFVANAIQHLKTHLDKRESVTFSFQIVCRNTYVVKIKERSWQVGKETCSNINVHRIVCQC